MTVNVLFLCTGNSARSIIAEVMVNEVLARPGVRAFSAGSQPTGQINPGAVAELTRRGCRTDGLASKSWDTFHTAGAPAMDWVITLCDSAADEACPAFSGPCNRSHWGLPDPASGAATFAATFDEIYTRVESFYLTLNQESQS